jgi:ribose transport system substrate-binding protein
LRSLKLTHALCLSLALAGTALTAPAFAEEFGTLVEAARQPLAAWPGPTAAVAPASGKTIYVVTCSSQGIGCVRAANGVEEAGAALGWTVQVIDGRGDPGAWNGAILSALSGGGSGIVLAAVPPMLVGDALERAQQAGLPVVSVFNPMPDADSGVFAYVRPDHEAQGRLAADWVASVSGGNAKILMVQDREFPELNQRVDGFTAEIAKCGGCTIVDTVDSTIGTMAERLPGAVATALSRYPDVDYVIAPFDSNAFFVGEGVRQAGRTETVKIAGYEGDPQAVDAVRQGLQAMTIADPAEWMGWAAVDELARAFAGAEPANVPVPFRLIDQANAPDTAGWMGDVDFRAEYKTLWGVQ